jgi:WD40 repeat protein
VIAVIARVLFAMAVALCFVGIAEGQSPSKTGVDPLNLQLPDGAVARLGRQRFNGFPMPGEYTGHTYIGEAIFSRDGKRLATRGVWPDRSLHVWDVATGNEIRGPWNASGMSHGVSAISHDGRVIATSCERLVRSNILCEVIVWDLATGRKLAASDPDKSRAEAMVFSKDGKSLVICSGQTVEWLDVDRGGVAKTLRPLEASKHADAEGTVTHYDRHLSPNGDTLVVFSQRFDKAGEALEQCVGIAINLVEQKKTWRLGVVGVSDHKVAFSADGKRIAVAVGPTAVEIRDLTNGNLVAALRLNSDLPGIESVTGLALSFDGTMLAVAGLDGHIALWTSSLPPRTLVSDLPSLRTAPNLCLSISPDNTKFVLAAGAEFQIFDLATLNVAMNSFAGHRGAVNYVSFSQDGTSLISGGMLASVQFNEVMTWEVSTWQRRRVSLTPTPTLRNIGTTSPEHAYFFGQTGDDRFNLYELPSGKKMGRLPPLPKQDTSVIDFFTPGSRLYFIAATEPSKASVFRLYAIPSCKLVCEGPVSSSVTANIFPGSISPVSVSADNRYIAVAREDLTIEVYEIATGKLRRTLRQPLPQDKPVFEAWQGPFVYLALSRDGKKLASVTSSRHAVTIWDVSTGRKWDYALPPSQAFTRRPTDDAQSPSAWAWSQDGNVLALAIERKIYLLEIATQRVRHVFSGHAETIWSLAFSPNGRFLASGSADTSVLIWDMCAR